MRTRIKAVTLPRGAAGMRVNFFAACELAKRGIVPLVGGGGRQGRARFVGLAGLVVIYIAPNLRAAGCSFDTILEVSKCISRAGEARILQALTGGVKFIVCAAGKPPQLVRELPQSPIGCIQVIEIEGAVRRAVAVLKAAQEGTPAAA